MNLSKEERTLIEVQEHYSDWTDDMETRLHRKNGWNDVTDAYWGELPEDWPYISRVVDPRIRTSIIEKDARLINSKLRGRLVPREGGDVLGAKLNNAILDYQWDTASHGGSMESKILISSQDTRLYGSKFAFIPWKVKYDKDGKLRFEGNEMEPLDIRDCGIDPSANHIRDAKWFQHRKWWFIEDLNEHNKHAEAGAKFKFTRELQRRMKDPTYQISDKRKNEYVSRVRQLKGLEDRLGEDIAFPVVELVTEYREDRWITFAPQYNLIVRDIKNPFDHGKIPIAQLRYYPLQDDPLGESEVEPVLPLWKAIQAVVCGYLDEMNIKMRPPLKILDGQARIETIVYGPEAQWIVNRQDAVMEMQSNGEAQRWFQSTYSALVSAFNTAMGDLSQGISNASPFEADKTATEIKKIDQQQQARDQRNQNELAEFIKDIMKMWLSNNRQFLFSEEGKSEHVLRIVGTEAFNYFKRAGLDEMEITDEGLQMVADIIAMRGGQLRDMEVETIYNAAQMPKFPIQENPGEEDIEKISLKPKMRLSDMEDSAELSIVPQDLEGNFDYIADVKSMSIGAGQELQQARLRAVEMLTSNQALLQQLQQEGYVPNVKQLVTSTLEELGLKDADRFFQQLPEGQPNDQEATTGAAAQTAGSVLPNQQVGGLPTAPQAAPTAGFPR